MASVLTRDEAIKKNQGLVVKMARKYTCQAVEFHDLMQAGNLGLLEAFNRFDPDRGVKFVTYAYRWVQKSIKEEVYRAHLVRLPQNVQALRNSIAEAGASINSETGEQPDSTKLGDLLDESPDKIDYAMRHSGTTVFFEGEELVDRTSLEDMIGENIARERIQEAFQALNALDKQILMLRSSGLTLDAVGDRVGYTRERVRQRQNAAISRLRTRAKL